MQIIFVIQKINVFNIYLFLNAQIIELFVKACILMIFKKSKYCFSFKFIPFDPSSST